MRLLPPWLQALPGRLLHTHVAGCTIFAAVSGSSAATCATIGKMTLPELSKRGYPEDMVIGTLAGAGTLGLLIPPSIIMIVYGVTADVSIAKLFIAGVLPGLMLACLFSGYIIFWALRNPELVPAIDRQYTFMEKVRESGSLIPVVCLIVAVLGSIYAGIATATEAAAVGVVGAMVLSGLQGSLNWFSFKEALMGATRLYCMIALILAGASFLTLSMGYIGLPRHLAEWIATLGLSQFELILALTVFYVVLGCFLDGISMVVLTMGVIMPTVQKAGIDPLWFGIFIVLVVEMAQITPPVGFNLFVLQGMTGKDLVWIAKVTLPMFFLMVVAVLLIYFPEFQLSPVLLEMFGCWIGWQILIFGVSAWIASFASYALKMISMGAMLGLMWTGWIPLGLLNVEQGRTLWQITAVATGTIGLGMCAIAYRRWCRIDFV